MRKALRVLIFEDDFRSIDAPNDGAIEVEGEDSLLQVTLMGSALDTKRRAPATA